MKCAFTDALKFPRTVFNPGAVLKRRVQAGHTDTHVQEELDSTRWPAPERRSQPRPSWKKNSGRRLNPPLKRETLVDGLIKHADVRVRRGTSEFSNLYDARKRHSNFDARARETLHARELPAF